MARAVFERAMKRAGVGRWEPVSLAFSGGADSTALLVLAMERQKAGVTALVVDHGIVPGSGERAERAKRRAEGLLGARARVVKGQTEGVKQAEARRARFAGLLREAGGERVLVAHHGGTSGRPSSCASQAAPVSTVWQASGR